MAGAFSKLLSVSEDQWGLVTRSQATRAGVVAPTFARFIDRGLLERVARGVYRVRAAGEADHLLLRAAWLQLDPERPAWERLADPEVAIVSHASAAAMYGVGELRADVHEFTCATPPRTRRHDVVIHPGRVPERERVILRGLPVTRAGRAIADLVAEGGEPEVIARITVEVLEKNHDDPAAVAAHLAPFAPRFGLEQDDGVAVLERFLDIADGRLDRETILAEERS